MNILKLHNLELDTFWKNLWKKKQKNSAKAKLQNGL